MSSFRRNTLGASSVRRLRAPGAALALTLASGAALAHGAQRFTLTVYRDAAGGEQVVAGHYRDALRELKRSDGAADPDPAAANTNRCVAYAMTLQWREAQVACDAAVLAASRQRDASPAWLSRLSRSEDERLALAYANRAVLHWMSHDAAAARRDLASALELSPAADFVAQNFAALKAHAPVALAGAAEPKG